MSNTTNNAATCTDTFSTFKVGDPVNWNAGSDIEAGTVFRVTKTQVIVRRVETTLLNASDSGEADALHVAPGGFAAHVSGTQRWAFGDMTGGEIVFSRRVKTIRGDEEIIAKMRGTSMKGSMHSWGILRPGHLRHYDYNY